MLRKFFPKYTPSLKCKQKQFFYIAGQSPLVRVKNQDANDNPVLTLQGNEALQVSPHSLPSTRGSILAVPN